MKVISGFLKGREISGFRTLGTRPTMDRVKESLFAIIQEHVKESILLDLFSGSGNLAIEAISQGAKFAYCNDKGKTAFQVIKKNMIKFHLKDQMVVTNYDFKIALKMLREKNIIFDLIFLDPPYDTNYINESLKLICQYQLLNENGIIVCETDHIEKISDCNFQTVKSKKYGDKVVAILKRV